VKLSSTKTKRTRRQRGYILLVILLFATAMVISALSATRLYVGRIKRERELETVHRGAQYSRAVQKYFKKFRRYPMKLEDLENTNNIRFLRQRYKDPMTGKDFKLLHFGEVQLQPKGPNAATNPGVAATSLTSATGQAPASPITTPGGAPATSQPGAGPIIGVESTSKKKSILEFNGKDHYNEWEFVYDPSFDRGGLIRGPYNGQSLLPTQQQPIPGGPKPTIGTPPQPTPTPTPTPTPQ
jgi:type II secretory pathway pseudopilin PulG